MDINNNIQEPYCSFEVSKLLKEKGFEIWTYSGWTNNELKNGFKELKHEIYRPTQALAIEWIRVNFGIWIFVCWDALNKKPFFATYGKVSADKFKQTKFYNKPQEATEAALLYTLQNLIK